ncbi:MAG: Lrp/AsnC family transcriptional regulator [Phycisphaeraceae bacterium]|nr:Lrp/AsnC family transcriptional regulator [Phycisphaeraceae bacterium]
MPIPISIDDPINARILKVSEDRIAGYCRQPLHEIARLSDVDLNVVVERLRAMLEAKTIRRIRQTLLSTSLAPGALVAWQVPPEQLNIAFEFMFREDPFSGHVVIRTTDSPVAGSAYRLWTTLKVPTGFDMDAHCRWLMRQTGATRYLLLPAKKVFTLGVGHVRRRELSPGDRTDEPGRVLDVEVADLTEKQWHVLMPLKREFEPEEIVPDLWTGRADEAGVCLDAFHAIAEDLAKRQIIGRFSTFLEHVKKLSDGQSVTRYNALFHWAVPAGQELAAGREVGRHTVMTHAYWREGGPEFNHVNIMGVAHGLDKDLLLAHKDAIDTHLREAGIDLRYTNVFWGGRSEIKPSEISPLVYRQWAQDRSALT